MPTPQEQLLAERIQALNEVEAYAQSIPDDARDAADKQALLADIAAQRQVMQEEARIRDEYRRNAEALARMEAHEALKALQRKLPKPLTQAQAEAYQKSLAEVMKALKDAGQAIPKPYNPQDMLTRLQGRKADLQKAFSDLQKGNAALYNSADGVAGPCVPCLQNRASYILGNQENRRRAAKSMSAFAGQQNNKDSCALMSTRSVLQERDGSAPDEGWAANPSSWRSHFPTRSEVANTLKGVKDMIDIGKASGAYKPCNGTTDTAAVMRAAGIPATALSTAANKVKPTLDHIADALDQGKAVLIDYDARPVWFGSDPTQWTDTGVLGHAVRATGVERNGDGTIRGFWINDSGDGQAGRWVPADAMRMALDRRSNSNVVTSDSPLNPPVYALP